MLSTGWMLFFTFSFVIGQFLSMVIEASASPQMDALNIATNYNLIVTYDIGVISIPFLSGQFFTEALPRMILWDYAFFHGDFEWIRFFLIPFSIVFVLAFAMMFITSIQGFFRRI